MNFGGLKNSNDCLKNKSIRREPDKYPPRKPFFYFLFFFSLNFKLKFNPL
jgi:hypothetical protein